MDRQYPTTTTTTINRHDEVDTENGRTGTTRAIAPYTTAKHKNSTSSRRGVYNFVLVFSSIRFLRAFFYPRAFLFFPPPPAAINV